MREACKETRTSDHSQEKKKLPEILLKEEQMLNVLEKDFKSTFKYAQKYKSNHGQKKRGMVWGGRREEGSGWAKHVYLWRIHFDIWQN